MSKIDLVIKHRNLPKMSHNEIPKGTFFTGSIGIYTDRAFIKSYDRIVSLEDGKTWDSHCEVENYCECDVEILLKPVS